ncbi:MAG: glycosyltransferase family 2 protein [Ignavibacteriales bacterium]|nr:glycosyltransferase family 2 protein [Ignavibacteriales bacterium]
MLSIIIVQYNNQFLTEQCIRSIKEHCSGEYEIILVDNGSSNSNPEKIKSEFPEVKLIVNEKNEGFGKANNLGSKIANGDILLLLNNDTIVTSDFVEKISLIFSADDKLGAIGPQLLNHDGTLQLSWSKLPSFVNEFITKIESDLFYKNNNFVKKNAGRKYQRQRYVDFITAAALFIRKNLYEQINGFDENFFMYFEDSDFCLRIKEAGKKIVYYPDIKIIHLRGASSSKNIESFIKRQYRLSQLYYYQKHKGGLEQLLLKLYLKLSKKYPVEKPHA